MHCAHLELAEHKEAEAIRVRDAAIKAAQEVSLLEAEAHERGTDLEECRLALKEFSLRVKVPSRLSSAAYRRACRITKRVNLI